MKSGASGLSHSGKRLPSNYELLVDIERRIPLGMCSSASDDELPFRMMDDYCELFALYKEYSCGGRIWLMLGLDTSGSDYEDILAIANCLAEKGHEVKVLHAVHYKDPVYRSVFGELIGTRYYRKCPDLLVDGNYVEYESYTSDLPKNAFRNMLHNGLAQSDCVIIRQCGLTDGYMIQQIEGQIRNGIPVTSIWIFNGQDVRPLLDTEG